MSEFKISRRRSTKARSIEAGNTSRISFIAYFISGFVALAISGSPVEALAQSSCESMFSAKSVTPQSSSPSALKKSFQKQVERYFSNKQKNPSILLKVAAQQLEQSGVKFEWVDFDSLDTNFQALHILPERGLSLLNDYAAEINELGVSRVLYAPGWMKKRNSNGAFSMESNFVLLPHVAILIPNMHNAILRHELRHVQLSRLELLGVAPLSSGWVTAKDGVQIWSEFKSLKGRYQASHTSQEIDTYASSALGLVEDLARDWPELSSREREQRFDFLQSQVGEAFELAKQHQYIYGELKKELPNGALTLKEALKFRSQNLSGANPLYEPILVSLTGPSFEYKSMLPAPRGTGISLAKFLAGLEMTEGDHEHLSKLRKTLDLKVHLMLQLSEQVILMGPQLSESLAQIRARNPTFTDSSSQQFEQFRNEAVRQKQTLDLFNSKFDGWIKSLVKN